MQISYTKSAQHALKYAARAAREMKHPYIGTEHLLLALEKNIQEWQDRYLRTVE